MKSKISVIFTFLFFVLLTIFILRFIIGGDEDSWICDKGVWVKHGNPSAVMPQVECNN
jgi:hypothetical protein